MKTLFLLRHAKSSWSHPELSDYERPLNNRGENAAPRIGIEMAEQDFVPEYILSSPAKRAVQTVGLAAGAGCFEAEINYDQSIYGASPNTLLYIVAGFPDSANTALLVGHNPGFEMLTGALTNEYVRMPTATLAVIELDCVGWNEISAGCGTLKELIIARSLK